MARFSYEDVAKTPAGWNVRTVTRGSHRVRIAFPAGAQQSGSGRVVQILHPRGEANPCGMRYLLPNPSELLIMGANPTRRRPNPHTLGKRIAQMKDQGASPGEVGRFLSSATNVGGRASGVGGRRSRHNPRRKGRMYLGHEIFVWADTPGFWMYEIFSPQGDSVAKWGYSTTRAKAMKAAKESVDFRIDKFHRNPRARSSKLLRQDAARLREIEAELRSGKGQQPRDKQLREEYSSLLEGRGGSRRNPQMKLGAGDVVTFHGYDGKDYTATVQEIKRGFARIEYSVPGFGVVTALVQRKLWRQRFNNPNLPAARPLRNDGRLVDAIRAGDRVTIVDRFGKQRTGRAVMRSSAGGWVLNMGGAHGTPALADDSNVTRVKKAGHRETGALGRIGMANPRRGKYASLTVPEQHQVRIAKDTLKMPDAMLGVMGGMTKPQARAIIRRYLGEKALKFYDNPKRGSGRKVLWGTKVGAPDGDEQVITETDSAAHLAAAKKWAKENGFNRLRVLVLDDKAPDFLAAIGKRRGNPKSPYTGREETLFIEKQSGGSRYQLVDGRGNYFQSGTVEQLKKAAADLGYPVRVNPNGDEAAAELYEEFHGRGHKEILELQEPEARGVTLTSLGDLVALAVIPEKTRKWIELDFKGCAVKLASNAKGTQLYLVGGDQSLEADYLAKLNGTGKELIELGEANSIVYRASKSQTDFTPTDWEHHFGEEGGLRPIAAYDTRTKRILLVGGDYTIEAPGIIN